MIQPADLQQFLSHWWYAYDNAIYEEWPAMFTEDAHFVCRTDTGRTDFEEFVRADVSGRDEVLAWQRTHRMGSPSPLRHCAENVHITSSEGDEAEFRSYIWVTQIVGGAPSPLSTARVTGRVRSEGGVLGFVELVVVLDTEDSTVLGDRRIS